MSFFQAQAARTQIDPVIKSIDGAFDVLGRGSSDGRFSV
jgi:hypothetical protein